MRQKLALIRTLLHDPPVLLLDEPTSAMDPHSAKLVRDSILSLRTHDRAIVLCTHNLTEAELLADRIAIIRRGEIVIRGTVAQLKHQLLGSAHLRDARRRINRWRSHRSSATWSRLTGKGKDWIRYRTDRAHEINPVLLDRLRRSRNCDRDPQRGAAQPGTGLSSSGRPAIGGQPARRSTRRGSPMNAIRHRSRRGMGILSTLVAGHSPRGARYAARLAIGDPDPTAHRGLSGLDAVYGRLGSAVGSALGRDRRGVVGERLMPFLMMIVGFFPISFSLVIALETFVGEKERHSLEPLLATPLTNAELYWGKTLAAMIPPLVASYVGLGVYLAGSIFHPGLDAARCNCSASSCCSPPRKRWSWSRQRS